MLAQLTISNFAIVRELEIDFQPGMTAITGETGAGKSIAIDALGLCLGNRADGNVVRLGAARADLCARFSLADTPSAREWLEQNQLDDSNECLLRRVINADGRSRGFINGTAVPLSQLRELGQRLIQIHGQHAHQLLLKPEHQKALLDAYADEPALLAAMSQAYQRWHQSCRELAHHQQQSIEREARKQLLQYQLKELNEFAPQAGEFEQTDAEYKRLANSGQLLTLSQQTLQLLADSDENNMLSQLYSAKHLLLELAGLDDKLSGLLDMLEEASIQISEASDELRHYADRMDLDPNRLHELEQRAVSSAAATSRRPISCWSSKGSRRSTGCRACRRHNPETKKAPSGAFLYAVAGAITPWLWRPRPSPDAAGGRSAYNLSASPSSRGSAGDRRIPSCSSPDALPG